MTTETLPPPADAAETIAAPLTFADLGLPQEVCNLLSSQGIIHPTPIQARAIPLVLQGRDVLGQADTGTGKTAAYGLPLLQRISLAQARVQVLVLVPTRELALQVVTALRSLVVGRDPGIVAIYGGDPIGNQIRQLRNQPAVVVATPGRLMDHLQRRTIDLEALRMCVLDEADEMLDMGFLPDVEAILEQTPRDRQTMLFSATMANEIAVLAKEHLRNPELVAVVSQRKGAPNVEQRYVVVQPHGRAEAVARLLDVEVFEAALVFARTKAGCDEMTEALQQRGVPCEALHGDLAQPARENVIRRLREGRLRVVVATDVAARGLDVPSLDLVVTVELPGQPETYVHRIGRTGRAGRSGKSILVLGPRDERRLIGIEKFLGQRLTWQAVPTPAEVAETRRQRFGDLLRKLAAEPETAPYRVWLQRQSAAEGGPAMLDLAAALCRLAAPTALREALAQFSADDFAEPAAPPPSRAQQVAAQRPAPVPAAAAQPPVGAVVAAAQAPVQKAQLPATAPAPVKAAPTARAAAPAAASVSKPVQAVPVAVAPVAPSVATATPASPAGTLAGEAEPAESEAPAVKKLTPRQIRRAEKAAADEAAGIIPAWKLAAATTELFDAAKSEAKAAKPAKPAKVAPAAPQVQQNSPPQHPGHLPSQPPRPVAMTAADRRRHPEFFAISVGIGARNGVSTAMLVAVLARCLDIPGKAIGRIEIRDNYSLIEVPAEIAPEVPTRLHGVEMCGRYLSPRPAREVLERERAHHRVR